MEAELLPQPRPWWLKWGLRPMHRCRIIGVARWDAWPPNGLSYSATS
jgi:hypothetical protein